MKSITIKGTQRYQLGKVATKTLRSDEKVPCILYGGNHEPLHFFADELSFSKLVYTPEVHTVVIELSDGKSYPAILQNIQFHPVSDKILHIDFVRLYAEKEVTMDIPVQLVGRSGGVLAGGILKKNIQKLRLKALPAHLPDYIEADITPLNIGDKLYITALKKETYKFLHPDNMVVCQINRSRAAVEVVTEETPAPANAEKAETPA